MQNFKERTSHEGKRKRYVYYPATSGSMIKLEIAHADGGANYFSGGSSKRGIVVMATRIELSDAGNGVMMESCNMFDDVGDKMTVVELARYNGKKIEIVAETFDANAPDISALWMDRRGEAMQMLRDTAAAALANANM